MPVALRTSLLVVVLLGLGACRERGESVSEALVFGPGLSLPAPATGEGKDLCLDLADRRACWPAGGGEPRIVHRPLPIPGVDGGWRCWGQGEARRCQPRSVGAGPWRCEEKLGCRRTHPRRPSDGEWECIEMAGVVICRHHGVSAGVIAGPPDAAWLCGGEPRICLDFSPDWPPGDAEASFACRFTLASGEPRACVPGPAASRVGDACASDETCPAGIGCFVGHCLPSAQPRPGCWTAKDCGEGKACLFGTCTEAEE